MLGIKLVSVLAALFGVFTSINAQVIIIIPSSSPSPSPVEPPFSIFFTPRVSEPVPIPAPAPVPAPVVTPLIDPVNLELVLVAAIEAGTCDRTAAAIAEDTSSEIFALRQQGEVALSPAVQELLDLILGVFLDRGVELDANDQFVLNLVSVLLQAPENELSAEVQKSLDVIIERGCALLFGEPIPVVAPVPEPVAEVAPVPDAEAEAEPPVTVSISGPAFQPAPTDYGQSSTGFNPGLGN